MESEKQKMVRNKHRSKVFMSATKIVAYFSLMCMYGFFFHSTVWLYIAMALALCAIILFFIACLLNPLDPFHEYGDGYGYRNRDL